MLLDFFFLGPAASPLGFKVSSPMLFVLFLLNDNVRNTPLDDSIAQQQKDTARRQSNSHSFAGEMSPAGELRWLCRLLHDSLRPYTVCFILHTSNSFFFFLNNYQFIPLTKHAFHVPQEPRAFVSTSKEKEKEILIASSQVPHFFSSSKHY